MDEGLITKCGFMVGLGETEDEIQQTMHDVRAVGCDLLTVGQYLQPSRDHLPVQRYVPPEEFRRIQKRGEDMGFQHVEAGPLVRSSYHAAEQALGVKGRTSFC
jgi:lipoic acid synthetase